MTDYRSHDYDMVVQLSQDALETRLGPMLPLAFLACSGDHAAVNTGEGEVTAYCGFGIPSDAGTIDFDTAVYNGIQLDIPFQLEGAFSSPVSWPATGSFAGVIRITPTIAVRNDDSECRVVLDLSGLTSDRVSITELNPLEGPWAGHEVAVQAWIEQIVCDCLLAQGEVDTTIAIPIDADSTGADPFMPIDVDLRVVAGGGMNCIALLLPTSDTTPRDEAGYSESTIGAGEELVLVLGNRLILHRVIGQTIIEMLEISDPANPAELAGADDLLDFTGTQTALREALSLDHLLSEWWIDAIRLSGLTITITAEERITLEAHVRVDGVAGAFTADVDFNFWFEVEGVTDNVVTLRLHLDEPQVALHLEWWVWLLLAVVLGPLGGLVPALLHCVVNPLIERFVWGLIGGFATAELPGTDDWPERGPIETFFSLDLGEELPPLPMDLQLDNIVLDDWACIGMPLFPNAAYEWPAPSLSISGDMQSVSNEAGGITGYGHMGRVAWTIFTLDHAHEGQFRALPGMMAHPIDFQWDLNGIDIGGDGTLTVDGVDLDYHVDGDRCDLSLAAGDSLDIELGVSAIDQRGIECYVTRHLSVTGHTSHGMVSGTELLDPCFIYQGVGALIESEPSPAEAMTTAAYATMVSEALWHGMGVTPRDRPSREQPA